MGTRNHVLRGWLRKGAWATIGLCALLLFNSCGTLLGGRIQTCQKIKPSPGNREIRPWAFAGDMLLFPIALPIDFYTGGIYKPCSGYSSMVINRKAIRQFYR